MKEKSPEGERPAAPQPFSIPSTTSDAVLNDIADVAARALDCPIAVISLVGRQRVWPQSYLDAGAVGTVVRDNGLCGIAVTQGHPWVIENAAVDLRTLADPLVAGNFGLRFYAGVPLRASDGHNLGMLAVTDRETRTISESDLTVLKKLAGLVEHLVEARLQLRSAVRAQNAPLTSVA